jgi:hypothetical protein
MYNQDAVTIWKPNLSERWTVWYSNDIWIADKYWFSNGTTSLDQFILEKSHKNLFLLYQAVQPINHCITGLVFKWYH